MIGFPKKTVATVVASFQKAVTELRVVAEANDATEVQQLQVAKEALTAANAAAAEASEARRVADKLANLIA